VDVQTLSILSRKFSALGPVSEAELRFLDQLPLQIRELGRDQDIVREGVRPTQCVLLLEGFACRYRSLPDGRRQILSFHIAGDFMDLQGYLLNRLDHNIATLIPSRIGILPYSVITEMTVYPNITRLLWRDTLLDGALHREWIVNVGRRTAYQRVAHVLCELVTRLEAIGMARDGVCDLPLTQADLADATGLSTVHVNRVIQELRRHVLIALKGRTFTALNWEGLKRAADFDDGYLQFERT
jgi:CRP-like cAMP-binding protein